MGNEPETRGGGNYRTSDLYFAAFLKTAGVPLIDSVKTEGRTYFLFEKQETIPDLKQAFFNRTAKVGAHDYADDIRSLKSMTFTS